jgi:hypothetical protein
MLNNVDVAGSRLQNKPIIGMIFCLSLAVSAPSRFPPPVFRP